jgi:hypothetical protein
LELAKRKKKKMEMPDINGIPHLGVARCVQTGFS